MHDNGACILLDFTSAFPSISQEYMTKVLTSIGVPASALNLIAALYDESYCRIQLNGITGDPFHLRAGVRQGCPLSPLLYAVIAEVLLDNIEHQCTHCLVRAYADDTALVVENMWQDGPTLPRLFKQLQAISGLSLNITKCIIIPLSCCDHVTFKADLSHHVPDWRNMTVASCGKYLGFYVGPGKGDKSWDGPCKKFIDRCQLWHDRPVGMHFHILAYNAFAITTLSYVAQLELPPSSATTAELQGLQLVVKGPGGISVTGWATSLDLWRLKEDYGQ